VRFDNSALWQQEFRVLREVTALFHALCFRTEDLNSIGDEKAVWRFRQLKWIATFRQALGLKA